MSNTTVNVRSRRNIPFNFEDGLKVKGKDIEQMIRESTCRDDMLLGATDLYSQTFRGNDVTDLEINVCMIVMGGTTRGDSNKGIFYYDPTSVAADNNSTVIKPTQVGNDSGRWLKLGSIPN